MARHVDFDAAWDAITGAQAAPTLTIHGETVTLPPDKPVALILLDRQLHDPDEAVRRSVTLTRLVDVLGIVVGADVVQRWIDGGIGFTQLATLVPVLRGMWLPEKDDDDPGEAPAPNGATD